MHVRTQPNLRPIIAAAALLGLSLTLASSPAAAQQWTPQQRAACEPDAMRLCQQYISDIGRVRSCMSHYRRYLSPACRKCRKGPSKKAHRRPDEKVQSSQANSGCMLSGARRVHPVIVGWSTANRPW